MTLQVGDAAPDFTLPADDGGAVSPADFRGRKLVIYFYPKDNTPGCTKEAIGFTELAKDFAEADTEVLGVSKDSVKKHQNFRNKHDLAIRLASDAESDVCERYGIWQEKRLYGRSFMGIVRTTFLIDRDGRIARIWPKVKVSGHAEEVLAAARELDDTNGSKL